MARLIASALFAFLLFFNLGSRADSEAMTQIRTRLDAHPVVRAEFVQTRTMADLQRPLVSRGRLVVWDSAGVIWQIEQPFRTTHVLREDSTVEIASDGRRTVRSARDDRGAARVGRVLRAVLKGDPKALDEWFDADAKVSGGRWTLALVPRQGPMAYFLKSVQLDGGEYLDSVRIVEENGDATQMQFRNQSGARAPSDEERRLLSDK
jgi:hypothetical protein